MRPYRLAVVPLGLMILWFFSHAWMGPHYLGMNADPDYAYLLNSLNLASGIPPSHIDHPGVPLQMLGAVVLRMTHGFAGQGLLADDVLQRPELYLEAISVTLALLLAAALFYLGWVVEERFRTVISGILSQTMVLVFPMCWSFLPRVSAEMPCMIWGTLFATALLRFQPETESSRRSHLMMLGLLCALAMTTKIIFLPLLIIPLAVAKDWKERRLFLGIVFVAGLLICLPVWPQFKRIARWIFGLIIHSGLYGSGEKTVFSPVKSWTWAWQFCVENPWYPAALILMTGVLRMIWHRRQTMEFRLLLGLVLFQAASFLMVMKHPAHRYLVPALSLLLPTLVLSAHLGKESASPFWRQKLPWLVQAGVGGMVIWSLFFGMPRQAVELIQARDNQCAAARLNETLRRQHPVIQSIFSSSQENALRFGNGYAGGQYSDPLARLVTDEITYDVHCGFFYTTSRIMPTNSAEAAALFATNSVLFLRCGWLPLLQDRPMPLPQGYRLEPYQTFGNEVFFRLQKGTNINTADPHIPPNNGDLQKLE